MTGSGQSKIGFGVGSMKQSATNLNCGFSTLPPMPHLLSGKKNSVIVRLLAVTGDTLCGQVYKNCVCILVWYDLNPRTADDIYFRSGHTINP